MSICISVLPVVIAWTRRYASCLVVFFNGGHNLFFRLVHNYSASQLQRVGAFFEPVFLAEGFFLLLKFLDFIDPAREMISSAFDSSVGSGHANTPTHWSSGQPKISGAQGAVGVSWFFYFQRSC